MNNIRDNDDVRQALIDREVHTCQTALVEFLISAGYRVTELESPVSTDDIENMRIYYTDEKGCFDEDEKRDMIEELEERKLKWEHTIESVNQLRIECFFGSRQGYANKATYILALINEYIGELSEKIEDLEELEQEYQDIMEWWLVTPWMYNKLLNHNEPVLTDGNNYWWGRTCTGQALSMDGVIHSICEEMEILEGQKNDWAIDYVPKIKVTVEGGVARCNDPRVEIVDLDYEAHQ